MALVQPEECAAPDEDPSICRSTGDQDTYKIRCASATVLEALCAIEHQRVPTSDVYCVRDHPHDAHVLFRFGRDALAQSVACLVERLQKVKMLKGDTATTCSMECPSFLEARVLRRALLTLVDVMACSTVDIIKNTSDHEDFIVAHRCGQLAIVGEGIESTASLHVCGRDALGQDLVFQTDAAVATENLEAPIVEMRAKQEMQAELYFTRGTPVEHAKYHCVASPSYSPEVILAKAPTRNQRRILHEYAISKKNVCTRNDGKQCRIEVVRELFHEGAPDMTLGGKITVGVESLGQMPASVCVQRAMAAVVRESEAILEAIKECGKASRVPASGVATPG